MMATSTSPRAARADCATTAETSGPLPAPVITVSSSPPAARSRATTSAPTMARSLPTTTTSPSTAPRTSPRWHHPALVSYTHLRAHETVLDLVCRLLLE